MTDIPRQWTALAIQSGINGEVWVMAYQVAFDPWANGWQIAKAICHRRVYSRADWPSKVLDENLRVRADCLEARRHDSTILFVGGLISTDEQVTEFFDSPADAISRIEELKEDRLKHGWHSFASFQEVVQPELLEQLEQSVSGSLSVPSENDFSIL